MNADRPALVAPTGTRCAAGLHLVGDGDRVYGRCAPCDSRRHRPVIVITPRERQPR